MNNQHQGMQSQENSNNGYQNWSTQYVQPQGYTQAQTSGYWNQNAAQNKTADVKVQAQQAYQQQAGSNMAGQTTPVSAGVAANGSY